MNQTNIMCSMSIRRQLLVTVSAAALLVSAYGAGEAQAADNDNDRPLLWIELGGQLEGLNSPQEAFSPPFMASITKPSLSSAMNVQQPAAYGLGVDGKISFQPENSDWVFSAALRFGRSVANQHGHHQTPNAKVPLDITLPPPYRTEFHFYKPIKYGSYYPHNRVRLADGKSSQSERHSILDFQAGKDVGLGLFGGHGSSVVSAGVRFAQFTSKSNVHLSAVPDLQYPTAPITGTVFAGFALLSAFHNAHIHFHDYAATANIQRGFQGIGPSLAWNASAPFAGDTESGEISLDWGANAALLFGRQKVKGHHQTAVKSYYYNKWHESGGANNCGQQDACEKVGYFYNKTNHAPPTYPSRSIFSGFPTAHHTNAANIDRTRSVTVPNVGVFAGLSYRIEDFKVSIGYRADFFFGAIDGGIDTAKTENRNFYGPFASVSVGVGG